jgi:hypothetical protein
MQEVIDIASGDTNATRSADAGLDEVRFGEICEEIRQQPNWRTEADKCADYYDDNQLDAETLAELEARGMGPLINNLIKPTINVVLGMEAKTRSDWRVIADSDEWQDVAEAQSAKLHESEREAHADRACSDAYAGQIKAGMGWIEVGREGDPFRYPYRVRSVHRREMFWDWRAKEPDLSDARYVMRQKWFDANEVIAFYPEHRDLIRGAAAGWPAEWLSRAKEDVSLMHSFNQEMRSPISDYEWRNFGRGQVSLYEVRYRQTIRGMVIELPDRRTVELDMNNPVHVAGIARGLLQPRPAVYSRWRRSIWLGPHKLDDGPVETKKMGYIPFWGYREDLTGTPYGLIRSMIPMQDEVNARRQKLMWMLSSKRVTVDSDALDSRYNDFADLVREVARPDAVVVTNPNRKNANAFSVDHQVQLSDQQYQVMMESKQAIQETAGVFNAMMGREGNASSGLAINSLVEQGTTALAEINDNYRYSRRLVGEAMLELIVQDLTGKEVDVQAGEDGRRKIISLNKKAVDPAGYQVVKNDVSKAMTKVALEDVPSTPAYRAQQMTMISEVMKSMPPEIQAPLTPFFLESTELPKRREMADLVRKVLGLQGPDGQPVDPEKQQLSQQVQLLTQQLQQVGQEATQKLQELEQAKAGLEQQVKNRDVENEIRAAELRLKELESTRSDAAEQARVRNENARMAAETARALAETKARDAEQANESRRIELEHEAKLADIDARRAEAESARTAAESAKEDADREGEIAKIQELIAKSMEPIAKQLEAMAQKPEKEEKSEPAEAPVMNFTFNVDAKPEAGKKSITVKRDAKGEMIGAEVDEK